MPDSGAHRQKATLQWRGFTDGTPWMHRAIIRLLRYVPISLIYFLMATSLPVYMVVRPRNTLAIWHYFRRRHGYGVFKTFVHLVRNHYAFGQVVIDRFASYAGKRFDIRLDGPDIYREVESAGTGFMTISSHVGNFEMAGYALHASRRLNVLGYGGEVEAVKSGRNRLLSENNIRMVPVTDGISHVFVLRECAGRSRPSAAGAFRAGYVGLCAAAGHRSLLHEDRPSGIHRLPAAPGCAFRRCAFPQRPHANPCAALRRRPERHPTPLSGPVVQLLRILGLILPL